MSSISRRGLLTGLAGISLTGVSAWVALDQSSSSDGPFPVSVETFRAQGSEAGTIELPVPNTVTVLDLFATWCSPCIKQLPTLQSLDAAYEDVAVVSVTNERTGETLTVDDIRAWWADHGGNWTVGHDPDSTLMAALNAGGLPYLAVFDASGTPVFQDSGVVSEARLRSAISEAKS